jgi:hypothetical protein
MLRNGFWFLVGGFLIAGGSWSLIFIAPSFISRQLFRSKKSRIQPSATSNQQPATRMNELLKH